MNNKVFQLWFQAPNIKSLVQRLLLAIGLARACVPRHVEPVYLSAQGGSEHLAEMVSELDDAFEEACKDGECVLVHGF